MAGGRPTKYDPKFAKQAKKLCEMGATDLEIADFFEVDVRTIYRWRNAHDEFCQALVVGKEPVDDRVERALFQRAMGYSHPDIDIRVVNGQIVETPIIKHYPPDTKAALAWLYNRRGDRFHPVPDARGNEDVPPLDININVKDAKGEVKVTRGKRKAKS